jgi:hypothetical protein
MKSGLKQGPATCISARCPIQNTGHEVNMTTGIIGPGQCAGLLHLPLKLFHGNNGAFTITVSWNGKYQ